MALTIKERFGLKRFSLGEKNIAEPVTLSHRRIFILPTARGLGCALLILTMLFASTIYGNNLGFILTFLLTSVVVDSIIHSFRTLAGLQFSSKPCQPVFAGEKAAVNCQLENRSNWPRTSVWLSLKNASPMRIDIEPQAPGLAQLMTRTAKRGWHRIGTVTIYSFFPLGLFRAWSPINLDRRVLVYPSPAKNHLPFPLSQQSNPDSGRDIKGNDDFSGFQQYNPGDSVKQIYWKALAKEQGLHTKQYSGDQAPLIWLDWEQTPGNSVEQRLSCLCRWVLDADQSGLIYGIRLPGVSLNLDSGGAHRSRCLKELALFGEKDF